MQIAKIFGVPLFLHWSWFLFIGIIGLSGNLEVLSFILAMFFFVILHEYGHCVAGQYFNFRAKRITLYPIGGIAQLDMNSMTPWQEIIVSVAGPLVNIVFSLVFFALLFFIEKESLVYDVFSLCLTVNILLGVFNLFALSFPLDGGRILRATLAIILHDFLRATLIAVRFSQILCFALMVVGIVFQDYILIFLFVLIAFAAQAELRAVERRHHIDVIKRILAVRLNDPAIITATVSELISIIEGLTEQEKEEIHADYLLSMLIKEEKILEAT